MTAPAQPVDDPGPAARPPSEWPRDASPLDERNGEDSAAGEAPGDDLPEDDLPGPTRRLESRLLPQYSFRTMAVGLTTLALAAFTYRQSTRGSVWAEALVFAAGTIVVCFLAYAALFLLAWIPALLGRNPGEELAPDNPFGNPSSAGQLPPQLVPPRDPID